MVLHRQHKMKLKELLSKITPLPWRRDVITGHLLFSNSRNLKREEDDIVKARAAYLTHAANVLPGLVNAVREYTKERDYQNVAACKKDQDRLEKLLLAELARAEEVEMENDQALRSAPTADVERRKESGI